MTARPASPHPKREKDLAVRVVAKNRKAFHEYFVEDKMEVYGHHVIGEIVGVLADESVLDEKDKVDVTKLNAFVFDQFRNGYYAIGEKVGQAWHTGAPLMKK